MKVYPVMVVSNNMLNWGIPKVHKLFTTRKLAKEYVKQQSSNKTRNEYYVGKPFDLIGDIL